VNTLLKIYDAQVYSARNDLEEIPSKKLKEGTYKFSSLDIEVIPILGHSDDSLVFRIGNFFFTGDVLSAGRTGTAPDKISRDTLFLELEEKLFTRDPHGILLPGHGPPTTIKAETQLYQKYEKHR
jgi:glyoxylase-like metal-dependent hydrolase (beta-lactamase superfamily II)